MVPILGSSIKNLHLVGHDFESSARFAFRAFPLPCLQPAFQVNMPTLIKEFAADFSQATEANDLKPLHSLTRSPVSVFPPFVYRKAESAHRGAFLAKTEFWGITKKSDQRYAIHT